MVLFGTCGELTLFDLRVVGRLSIPNAKAPACIVLELRVFESTACKLQSRSESFISCRKRTGNPTPQTLNNAFGGSGFPSIVIAVYATMDNVCFGQFRAPVLSPLLFVWVLPTLPRRAASSASTNSG